MNGTKYSKVMEFCQMMGKLKVNSRSVVALRLGGSLASVSASHGMPCQQIH